MLNSLYTIHLYKEKLSSKVKKSSTVVDVPSTGKLHHKMIAKYYYFKIIDLGGYSLRSLRNNEFSNSRQGKIFYSKFTILDNKTYFGCNFPDFVFNSPVASVQNIFA